MTIEPRIFDFESDFAASLRCIPMAVRFKLDLCAIKVSLRQWSRFTREDRRVLLIELCEAPSEIEVYRDRLVELIRLRADEPVKPLVDDAATPWNDTTRVPATLRTYAAGLGLHSPTLRQWAGLTLLQRYALIKLTRERHEDANFAPAMQEFGLLPASGSAPAVRAA